MSSSSETASTSCVDQDGDTTISTVHPDIIRTHILIRLDGQTLASAGCVSSELHSLCADDYLWRNICSSTWPSVSDPRVTELISTFPFGHRSFFSDAFPLLDLHRSSNIPNPNRSSSSSELISAVDFFHKDKLIFSKVQEMETQSGWFLCSPFRVDFLDPKESIQTPIRQVVGKNTTWLNNLEDNLTLSWIIIDPTRKRAVNLSSGSPVSVERHWLSGDIQVRYATVIPRDGTREMVQCGVVVTLGGNEGREMHVREVSMQVEDMDGKYLNGRDSLVLLENAIGMGKRKKGKGKGSEGKKRYKEYLEMKKERREREMKREKVLDLACVATGVSMFLAFWCYVIFR